MSDRSFEILHTNGLARVVELDHGRPLVTPTYFPAVSVAAMASRPMDLVRLIVESRYPRVLLSAYDVSRLNAKQRSWMTKAIHQYRASGNLAFIDCGVFESYWLSDRRWGFAEYETVIRRTEKDFYAAYDGAVHTTSARALTEGFYPLHVEKAIALAPGSQCVLIAHAVSPERLVKAVVSIVKLALRTYGGRARIPVLMVAVPERECGTHVAERAGTIAAIRRALDKVSSHALLHILGCGHPVSIATYSSAGADSFDSTDWCVAAIDWRNYCMTDFALLSATGCPCRACGKFRVENLQRGLLHNLLFYQKFCEGLQRMIRERTLRDFLLENLGITTFHRVSGAIKKSTRMDRGT